MTFLLSELVDVSNKDSIDSFAKFLFSIKTLENYKINNSRTIKTNEKGNHISYILRCSPLMPIKGDILKLNDFVKNRADLNDFDIEMFESNYQHSLKEYDIDLSEYEWN